MKSEERHELAQNDLEQLIERTRSRYAVVVEEHGNRIMLWMAAALLLFAAVIFYLRTSQSTNADGWSALIGAQSPEDLAGIAEAYKGTPVGNWARLNVGEQYFQSGTRLMFSDREASVSDLEEAKAAFEELLNTPKLMPEIRERALYGMARVLETTSDGSLKPALDAYNKLLQEFPNSPYQPVVEKQIAVLNRKPTQEFYTWFATQKPKPQDRQQPSDLMNSLNLEGLVPGGSMTTPTLPAESPAGTDEPNSQPNPTLSVPAAPDFPPTGSQPPVMKTEPAPAETDTPAAEPAATKPPATETTPEKPAAPAADMPEGSTEKPAAEPATEKPAPAPAADNASPEKPAEPAEPAPTEAAPAESTPAEPAAEKPPSDPAPAPAESSSNDGN